MSMTHTERGATHRAYEDEEEQEDYPMPHRYADARASGSDREISLGTGTILALFFALALVCSVFFGMGYTLGHKSTPPVTVAAETSTRSLAEAFKAFKPSPGTPGTASANKTATIVDPEDQTPTSSTAVIVPTQAAKTLPPTATKKPFDPDAEIVSTADPKPTPTPTLHPAPATSTPVAATSTPVAAPSGTALVQVAAVSHQEDADTLVAALKRKGYTVAVRHEPQDKLLHIQLGPYPSKKDAEAMRLRLQTDGYNAILK